jgi:hypothetical protein
VISVSFASGCSSGAARSDIERAEVKKEGSAGNKEKAAPPISDVPRNFRRVIIVGADLLVALLELMPSPD